MKIPFEFRKELLNLHDDGLFKKIPLKKFKTNFYLIFTSQANADFCESVFWGLYLYKFPECFINPELA